MQKKKLYYQLVQIIQNPPNPSKSRLTLDKSVCVNLLCPEWVWLIGNWEFMTKEMKLHDTTRLYN